jgi:hypothetical protein
MHVAIAVVVFVTVFWFRYGMPFAIMARRLGVLLLVCLTACSSPTAPEPVPVGYAGEWTGNTEQGTPVSFSVYGEEVTSFTLAFNFSSTCSGSVTSPSPMAIHTLDPPNPPPLSQEPGFGMGWPKAPSEWGVAVYGVFSPDRRSASGEFLMVRYPGCDIVMGVKWSARRR